MVTYRRDMERKGWHRPVWVRIGFVGVGLFTILIGSVLWSLQEVYGGRDPDLGHSVIGYDEDSGKTVVWNDAGEIVYVATSEEDATVWYENQRASDITIYAVPALVISVGGLLVVAGIAPSPKKSDPVRT